MNQLLRVFKSPFPKPKLSFKKVLWIFLLGLTCVGFILIYNPFEIANQADSIKVKLVLLSQGLIFSSSIILMEWGVPYLFPSLFKRWNISKAFFWYLVLTLFVSLINFLYKSYWNSFQDLNLQEFLYVIYRTIFISIPVAFFIVGIGQLFNRKSLYAIGVGEDFEIKSADGKLTRFNLSKILYVASDDNYVDIHYLSDREHKKITLRSSLKNIEAQIVTPISPIFRCHRQYLVNIDQAEIEKSSSKSMTLGIKGGEDQIPVSLKYVASIKQLLNTRP